MISLTRYFVKDFKGADCDPRLNSLIREVADTKVYVLRAVQPENVEDVKRRWLREAWRGRFTDPHFMYDRSRAKTQLWKEEALLDMQGALASLPESMSLEEEYLKRLLALRIKGLLESVEVLKAFVEGDSAELREAVINKYGRPKIPDAKDAETWLRRDAPYMVFDEESGVLQSLRLDAAQVAEAMVWALKQYRLDYHYEVIVDEKAVLVSVAHPVGEKMGRIVIPAQRIFNGVEVLRLIGHEIECHILDEMNAKSILHGMPRVSSELISEGRATASDAQLEAHFLGDTPLLRDKARLFIMTSKALRGERFGDLARWAHESVRSDITDRRDSLEEAWRLAYRVMRGASDGRNPYGYAFTKEYSYYAGYRYVQDFEGSAVWLASGLSTDNELRALSERYELTSEDLPWSPKKLAWSEELRDILVRLAGETPLKTEK